MSTTIYLTTQGSTIQRRSGQLVVSKGEDILQNIPEALVKQMVLFGNINVTTPVMAFCLEKQIEVVFLSQGGRFKGRLNSDGGKTAELRRKQYECALDAKFCLTQARAIVAGKIQNMIAFARRQNESQPRELDALKKSLEKAQAGVSIESLLGVEGSAAATYFRLFSKWLPRGWTFEGRTAYPPRDAVNALLSLSYTLIYNRVVSNVNVIGLDPYQGFYHAVRHGHAALGSDLMENFRPLFCDALVMRILKRSQIKPEQMVKESGEFRMSKEASKIFFTEFESKMNSRRNTNDTGDLNLTFSQIIKRQCNHFARVITGEEKFYKPFTLK